MILSGKNWMAGTSNGLYRMMFIFFDENHAMYSVDDYVVFLTPEEEGNAVALLTEVNC